MCDTHIHPNKVLLSAEMEEPGLINQTVCLQGSYGFIETALLNILLTIYERDSVLFFRVMDKFMEKDLK